MSLSPFQFPPLLLLPLHPLTFPYPFDPTVPFDALKVPGLRTFRAVGCGLWGFWVGRALIAWLNKRGIDFWEVARWDDNAGAKGLGGYQKVKAGEDYDEDYDHDYDEDEDEDVEDRLMNRANGDGDGDENDDDNREEEKEEEEGENVSDGSDSKIKPLNISIPRRAGIVGLRGPTLEAMTLLYLLYFHLFLLCLRLTTLPHWLVPTLLLVTFLGLLRRQIEVRSVGQVKS